MAPRSLTNFFSETSGLSETPSMFDNILRPWNEWLDKGNNRGTTTLPAVNISESKTEFRITLAAPGMEKEDFVVEIDANTLTIRSEKEETKEQTEEKFSRKEYNYASFSRSFKLPGQVERERIDASYSNGILEIKLPKKEVGKKPSTIKQITVK